MTTKKVDPQVAATAIRGLGHPLRIAILRDLATSESGVMSPSQIAEANGVPLPNLSYHMRMLDKLRLVELAKTKPRRGAIEHYYRATPLGEQTLDLLATMNGGPE